MTPNVTRGDMHGGAGAQSTALQLACGRLIFLGGLFMLAYAVVAVRVIDLMIVQGGSSETVQEAEDIRRLARSGDLLAHVRRGNIYDRNGVLLATSLKTPALYADPSLILDKPAVARALAGLFPDLKEDAILAKVNVEKSRYAWLRGNLSPAQQRRVLELGEPGLAFEYADSRIYPHGGLAAHLLGYTGRDGTGLSGIERGAQKVLAQGQDVILTIDVRLQHALHREIKSAIEEFSARAGAGMIMNARTGEILAGVSLPDYDLNFTSLLAADPEKNKEILTNRLTLGVYEFGSVFKIFTTAALLETQDAPFSTTFDARQPLKIGRYTINDYHAQKRILTVPEVFMHSSNIGSALMARSVGAQKLQGFLSDLGFMSRPQFDILEVGAPLIPKPWGESSTITVSYGHGISITVLQLCAATAAMVNGGLQVHPKLLLRASGDAAQIKSQARLVSEETSEKMRALLRLVVTQGTGKKADVPGYNVGGKTGTAEKSGGKKGYNRKSLLSSFIGAFPMDNPEYIVFVMIDEPQGTKKSYGYATGGWVAAPAAARVVTSMAAILGLPSDHYDPAQDISVPLERYLKPERAAASRQTTIPVTEKKELASN